MMQGGNRGGDSQQAVTGDQACEICQTRSPVLPPVRLACVGCLRSKLPDLKESVDMEEEEDPVDVACEACGGCDRPVACMVCARLTETESMCGTSDLMSGTPDVQKSGSLDLMSGIHINEVDTGADRKRKIKPERNNGLGQPRQDNRDAATDAACLACVEDKEDIQACRRCLRLLGADLPRSADIDINAEADELAEEACLKCEELERGGIYSRFCKTCVTALRLTDRLPAGFDFDDAATNALAHEKCPACVEGKPRGDCGDCIKLLRDEGVLDFSQLAGKEVIDEDSSSVLDTGDGAQPQGPPRPPMPQNRRRSLDDDKKRLRRLLTELKARKTREHP